MSVARRPDRFAYENYLMVQELANSYNHPDDDIIRWYHCTSINCTDNIERNMIVIFNSCCSHSKHISVIIDERILYFKRIQHVEARFLCTHRCRFYSLLLTHAYLPHSYLCNPSIIIFVKTSCGNLRSRKIRLSQPSYLLEIVVCYLMRFTVR